MASSECLLHARRRQEVWGGIPMALELGVGRTRSIGFVQGVAEDF